MVGIAANPRLLLAFLMLCVIAFPAVSCGGGGKEPSVLLGQVPDAYQQVTLWNVELLFQSASLEDLQDDFQDQWEGLEDYGIFSDDLDELVVAEDNRGNTLILLSGRLAFDEIRDALDDAGFRDSTYRDVEIWEQRGGGAFVGALLEDRNQVALSFPDDGGVREIIKVLDRGSGFLLEDRDSDMRRVLAQVGEGFHFMMEEECAGVDSRGCKAVAYSARRAKDGFSVELQWAFLFRRESSARSGQDDLEDYFDDNMPREVDVEEVEQQGEFVLVRALVDEGDFEAPSSLATVTIRSRPNTTPRRPRDQAAKAAERDAVQAAIDIMMVDNNLATVTAGAGAAKITHTLDFGGGQRIASYMRNPSTTFCYTWDTSGQVLTQSDC